MALLGTAKPMWNISAMSQHARIVLFYVSFAALFAVGMVGLFYCGKSCTTAPFDGFRDGPSASVVADHFVGPAVQTVDSPNDWKSLIAAPHCILFVDCPWNAEIAAYRVGPFPKFASWCRMNSDYVPVRVNVDDELRSPIAKLLQAVLKSADIPSGGLKTLGGAGRVIWMEKGRVRDYAWWHEVPDSPRLIRRTQSLFSPQPGKSANTDKPQTPPADKPGG